MSTLCFCKGTRRSLVCWMGNGPCLHRVLAEGSILKCAMLADIARFPVCVIAGLLCVCAHPSSTGSHQSFAGCGVALFSFARVFNNFITRFSVRRSISHAPTQTCAMQPSPPSRLSHTVTCHSTTHHLFTHFSRTSAILRWVIFNMTSRVGV